MTIEYRPAKRADGMRLVDEYTADLVTAIGGGADLGEAMRDLTLKHAAHRGELSPVQVLALDGCPRCGGRVLAGTIAAMCAAGCGWSFRRHGVAA